MKVVVYVDLTTSKNENFYSLTNLRNVLRIYFKNVVHNNPITNFNNKLFAAIFTSVVLPTRHLETRNPIVLSFCSIFINIYNFLACLNVLVFSPLFQLTKRIGKIKVDNCYF